MHLPGNLPTRNGVALRPPCTGVHKAHLHQAYKPCLFGAIPSQSCDNIIMALVYMIYCIIWIVSPGAYFQKGGLDDILAHWEYIVKGGLLSRGAYFREGPYFPDYTVLPQVCDGIALMEQGF